MTTPSASPARCDDLRAVFVNCTLEPSPKPSHTQLLLDESAAIMAAQGVSVDTIRAEDHVLAPGVQCDMTEHGAERDDWPELHQRVQAAHILRRRDRGCQRGSGPEARAFGPGSSC